MKVNVGCHKVTKGSRMYRVIYKSKAHNSINWTLVEDILHRSEKNNKKNKIGGILLASNTHFLQVLEGTYEAVNATFMRIARDNRHWGIELIAFHPIDAVLFEGWGMRGIGVFDINDDLAQMLKNKYGEIKGELESEVNFPLEEWKAMALIHDLKMVSDLPEWKR